MADALTSLAAEPTNELIKQMSTTIMETTSLKPELHKQLQEQIDGILSWLGGAHQKPECPFTAVAIVLQAAKVSHAKPYLDLATKLGDL